jgi:predicted DNA-binding protein (UPF0251 family)
MKLRTVKIVEVKVVRDKVLHILYSNGHAVFLDMADIVESYPVFAPLADSLEFTTVVVADWGWSLEWKCGATLDSDRVIELSLEHSGMATNVEFRRWQDKNGLSLSDAAQEIGLSRRTVSQYRTGARPVPRTVALACKGWEAIKLAA